MVPNIYFAYILIVLYYFLKCTVLIPQLTGFTVLDQLGFGLCTVWEVYRLLSVEVIEIK